MSLAPLPCRRKRIEDVRCPAVKGLPDDIYHILHHSFVHILKMRRSIEIDDALIASSLKAIIQSMDVLKRAQDELNTPLHVVPGVARCGADEKQGRCRAGSRHQP